MSDTLAAGPVLTAYGVNRIGVADLRAALAAGWDDFLAKPTHHLVLFLLYPIVGAVLSFAAFDYNLMPLVFPLIAGFAILAPVTAVGLYELSRRREAGLTIDFFDMFAVFRSPSLPGILLVAVMLTLLFVVWVTTAQQIVYLTIGRETPAGIGAFIEQVTTTEGGWVMLLLGNAIGGVFAIVGAAIAVFSLPLLVDGERSGFAAIWTSLRAVGRNPLVFVAWGIVVAVTLAVSMVPLFVGLLVTLPWLGHATWHLYRRTITRG
ncbi:MAG: DUF2189 domain-containing protein [Paracoccaceae bacterium]